MVRAVLLRACRLPSRRDHQEFSLNAAVEQARGHGATAVEGFPLAGDGPHKSDRYLGTEPLFAACGFDIVTRPSARRVAMRRDL